MTHKTITPGTPIAFRAKFNDGSTLTDNEAVRIVLYVNRLLNRLYGNEEGNDTQVDIVRADDSTYVDIAVTGEVAALLPEGFLKIELSVWDKTENVVKRRYERTVLEIGTYYNGSSWDLESNDDIKIELEV